MNNQDDKTTLDFLGTERRWYNKSDGHTYCLDESGELWGAPTGTDGEADWDSGGYADDFDEPLTKRERASILRHLRDR